MFHDATLLMLDIDWAKKSATVVLRTAKTDHAIVCHGFRQIKASRREAWGPSDSVNEAVVTATKLTLALQSGDEVTISADRIVVG